jgi:hypothetical protein
VGLLINESVECYNSSYDTLTLRPTEFRLDLTARLAEVREGRGTSYSSFLVFSKLSVLLPQLQSQGPLAFLEVFLWSWGRGKRGHQQERERREEKEN